MTEYSERACIKLEEEQNGEVGKMHFIKYHLTTALKNQFGTVYSNLISRREFEAFKESIWYIYAGIKSLIVLLIIYPIVLVLGPFWIPLNQLNEARRNWSSYKSYLEDKKQANED